MNSVLYSIGPNRTLLVPCAKETVGMDMPAMLSACKNVWKSVRKTLYRQCQINKQGIGNKRVLRIRMPDIKRRMREDHEGESAPMIASLCLCLKEEKLHI